MYYCIVEVNYILKRMSAKYIYSAPVSGVNGFMENDNTINN